MRILAVSGSLRAGSHNTSLLQAAIDAAPEGVDVELWEGIGGLPIYDQDLEGTDLPESVRRLREDWGSADAILFATPEYNGSVPGGLKNAVDWLSRPLATSVLRNKPVAVVGASTGAFGAVWAQAELRKVLATAGARVVEGDVAVGHAHERFADGRLLDENLLEQLQEVVDSLVAEVRPRQSVAA